MRVTVLGATGSIGRSTLDVVGRHPARFRVHALTAHRDAAGLLAQCLVHRPRYAVLADPAAAQPLARGVREAGLDTEVLSGAEALVQVAEDPNADTVVAAIVGAAGLLPSLAAVRAGKRVLLANKEALVCAGAVFMAAVRDSGATLLPLDSEHNAVFQCLPEQGVGRGGVRRILLTASGGPFRETPPGELANVTPEQACAHPNWSMGRKISVDSATMMNKGLEVIEACWLFHLPPAQVEVVVHPESVIHSLVEYTDGSMLAQLGNPDMRTPIAHALAWPERIESGVAPLDLVRTGQLNFQAPDPRRFPCLGLAYSALRAGGNACAVLNAANEVAVEAFLAGRIGFMAIAELVERTLERIPRGELADLEAVLAADTQARETARQTLEAMA
ncbi:1-deoxy-D-xylulose-5-phosphate reductoisomerase [Alkalilimnicola sp. S0819]|uniref:1-deoxy-D-xylulose-5-phosphate reductoisomerase n=1 Tax=Alkalilimnicola sp. S0819 TaxID=2613922 RepID=UPI00126198D0|nr:1-deoxy-D-xylulose-5-phosphate reductoisomerase [Alkalilimnicola sp. S0819]KAB7627922.1 1-deoxy-D-xylulose-5-phosphate reductoisomerase [Alkalilimnicola sp. S0819]MPQ15558.1 1-deoxy-D-xylulose-5-phosphate reductoisomerase [Alkalilimnicola sp. S0819]